VCGSRRRARGGGGGGRGGRGGGGGGGGGGKDQFVGNEISGDREHHARPQKRSTLSFLSFKIVEGTLSLPVSRGEIYAHLAITYARASLRSCSRRLARSKGIIRLLWIRDYRRPGRRVDEHSSNLRRNRSRFSCDLISTVSS